MNEDTKAYIKECGLSIQKYWELHPAEQAWLYPILQKSVRSAIAVMETISVQPRNYEEISKITNLNKNTVKQLIYALSDAGMGIKFFNEDKVYCPIGRKSRNLKLTVESIPH